MGFTTTGELLDFNSGRADEAVLTLEFLHGEALGSNLLATRGWRMAECAGLGQGFIRCSRHIAFGEYMSLG